MNGKVIFRHDEESLVYYPGFFHSGYFDRLLKEIAWGQNQIRMFGKLYDEPRLTAWYGPPYAYSGISWPAQSLNEVLTELIEQVIAETHFPFNAVLANQYRNGSDSIGWHRDNEKGMNGSLIASASFGGKRIFKVRNPLLNIKHDIELHDSSLLLMYNLQQNWQHAVPKSKTNAAPRINLTFRQILPA